MEDDEDDFYADAQHQGYGDAAQEASGRDVKMEASENEDEDEEEDSDDVCLLSDRGDVEHILTILRRTSNS